MSSRILALSSFLFLAAAAAGAGPRPEAEISNGAVTAKVYLPDPDNGYYRGTRFDWSGVVYSLAWQGHEYFGEWQVSADPLLHDRITGPVEEFRTAGAGLGYAEAPGGGTFIRIGIGLCEKPEGEKEYRWTHTYKVVDPGKRTMRRGRNWIEFGQELDGGTGYAYVYTKRLTLTEGKPELVIAHTLTNTGKKVIETETYNHNFFVIDKQPTGPGFVVRFPFAPRSAREDRTGAVVLRDRELSYSREIRPKESVMLFLEGFEPSVEANRFEIENRTTGAGVRAATDKPLVRLNFWSPRTTLSPEPYISLKIAPGASERWTARYEFYTVK